MSTLFRWSNASDILPSENQDYQNLKEPVYQRSYQWFQCFSSQTRARPCSWRWVPRCGCKTNLGWSVTIPPALQARACQGCLFTTRPSENKEAKQISTRQMRVCLKLGRHIPPNGLSSFSFFFKAIHVSHVQEAFLNFISVFSSAIWVWQDWLRCAF